MDPCLFFLRIAHARPRALMKIAKLARVTAEQD